MTPEEYKQIEPELLAVINRIISKHVCRAYEDAAKIVEETDWEAMGPGWRIRDRIAAAIRSLMWGK
jgi:hypothetical protein